MWSSAFFLSALAHNLGAGFFVVVVVFSKRPLSNSVQGDLGCMREGYEKKGGIVVSSRT